MDFIRIGISALFWLLIALNVGATQQSRLEAEFQNLIREANAEDAFWGVYVRDLETGQTLVDINGSSPMIPASNQKILSAAAALEYLGPDYRYRTILYLDGRLRGTEFEGDVIIRGSGDPTFGSSEVNSSDVLRDWAQRLRAIGITKIRGRLIGDADVFDDEPYAEGWDIDYVTGQPGRMIGVSAGGLSYSDNLVAIRIQSSRPGTPPSVRLTPSDYLNIDNRLVTSTRSRGIDVNLTRIVGEETVRITGSVPRRYEGTTFMPVADPTRFTMHSFARRLTSAGIELDVQISDAGELSDGISYDSLDPLFVHFSPPMTEIVRVVNKISHNFYAEQIFRTFAYGGSGSGGERRIKELMSRAGVDPRDVSARDGSGLSRKDLVAPEALVQLLAFAENRPWRDAFIDSLPEGGEPRTTLRYRLHDAPVRAKTGSIEFVRALSGYVTTPDGRRLAFAIMANHYMVPSFRVVQTIDQMVLEMSRLSVS